MTIYKLTIEGRLTVPEEEREEFEGTRDLLQRIGPIKSDHVLKEALRELENCPEVTIKLVEEGY